MGEDIRALSLVFLVPIVVGINAITILGATITLHGPIAFLICVGAIGGTLLSLFSGCADGYEQFIKMNKTALIPFILWMVLIVIEGVWGF